MKILFKYWRINEEEITKKSKSKLNREAKIAAAKSAISKLTSEEIKLLGLKLHKLINKTY